MKFLFVWLIICAPLIGFSQQDQQLSRLLAQSDSLLEEQTTLAESGDFEQAIDVQLARVEVLTAWRQLKDSLDLVALADSLQLQEREAAIELSKVRTGNQRMAMLWIGGLILLAGLAIWAVVSTIGRRRRKEQELHDLEAQTLAVEIEQNTLLAEKAALDGEAIQRHIDQTNQQLSGRLLQAIRHNRILREVSQQVDSLEDPLVEVNTILTELHTQQAPAEWEAFLTQFDAVYPGFFDRIQPANEPLTDAESRLAALLRMQLSSKEIAALLGITPDSVKTSRYRLAKKLPLADNQKLTDYLMGIG